MKKFLSIVAIAMMALSFSSCKDNDDDSNASSNKCDTYVVAALTADQSDYLDQSYVITVDGTKKTVKLSDMTEADKTVFAGAYARVSSLLSETGVAQSPKLYVYNAGKLDPEAQVYVTQSATVKSGHPAVPFSYMKYMLVAYKKSNAQVCDVSEGLGDAFKVYSSDGTDDNALTKDLQVFSLTGYTFTLPSAN